MTLILASRALGSLRTKLIDRGHVARYLRPGRVIPDQQRLRILLVPPRRAEYWDSYSCSATAERSLQRSADAEPGSSKDVRVAPRRSAQGPTRPGADPTSEVPLGRAYRAGVEAAGTITGDCTAVRRRNHRITQTADPRFLPRSSERACQTPRRGTPPEPGISVSRNSPKSSVRVVVADQIMV